MKVSSSSLPQKIDVMKESPLDSVATPSSSLVQIKPLNNNKLQWVPSRFNARTTADDGSVILWNTYTGAISVFKPEQKPMLEKLLIRQGFSGELSGLAKYLHERGFIVPKGTNEYRRFQLVFGQQHYHSDVLELILLASEDCNFRCVYCYEDFPRGTMLPSVREGIKKLVEKRAHYLQRLRISWFGGEPLYGFQAIEDLAPFFLEIADQYSLDYSSHMTTNGYLLTPDIAEKLLTWKILDYQITIDGLAERHDQKRRARDGSGTFHTIHSNLQALKRREDVYSVTIRVNFDRENYPQLEEFLVLLQKEFAGDERFNVAFHVIGQWGGPNDASLAVCGSKEASLVRSQLQKSASEKGLKVSGTLREMNGAGCSVCYAARPYNFIISADGKVMKCTVALDKKDYNVVGRLSEDGELQLDNDKLSLWVEPAFERDAICQKCYLLPTCQGISCPLVPIEEKKRPCLWTKANLRNELITALEIGKSKARYCRV